MLDFTLTLELMSIIAVIVYIGLLITENLNIHEADTYREINLKKSLHEQHLFPRV